VALIEAQNIVPVFLGVVAGALQIIGYCVYIRFFLQETVRPNSISWLMFGYGTALMLLLELGAGANWTLLVLPAACAAMSLVVAALCFRTKNAGPANTFEKAAFGADIGLTIGYLLGLALQKTGSLFATLFLAAGNLTTLTAFLPILKSTWEEPERERLAPWLFWILAYGALLAATLVETGTGKPELLMYPAVSLLLHTAIGLMIVFKRSKGVPRPDQVPSNAQTDGLGAGAGAVALTAHNVYTRQSAIAGLGIFATRKFGTGSTIAYLTGELKLGDYQSSFGPNWVGIGNKAWIDPDYPFSHTNHSCEPNTAFGPNFALVALKDIKADEEITFDYSTTEADLNWSMECSCATPSCRRVLRSIQIAFPDPAKPPNASPAMLKVWQSAHPKPKASGPHKRRFLIPFTKAG
jgi:SET domain